MSYRAIVVVPAPVLPDHDDGKLVVEWAAGDDDVAAATVKTLVGRYNAGLTEHVRLRMSVQWPYVVAWWLGQLEMLDGFASLWIATEFDVEFDIGWVLYEGDDRELCARLID